MYLPFLMERYEVEIMNKYRDYNSANVETEN